MGETLKILAPWATAIVAVYVAYIGTLQWKIAAEKLRLDLYDRRFKVYQRTVEYVNFIGIPGDQNDAVYVSKKRSVRVAFLDSLQESKFLFDEASGIHKHLLELSRRSLDVIETSSTEQNKTKLQVQDESRKWMASSLDTLDTYIAPYLNFGVLHARSPFDDLLDSPD